MNKKHTDNLYASPQAVSGFIFDDKVAAVFPDMIERSVPGYGTIIHMIGQLASRYATAHSHCYDLGCSLGAAALAMRGQLGSHTDVKVIGVDSSAAMLARCRSAAAEHPEAADIELRCEDILDTDIQRASVVVLNFTLQFIALPQREHLIANIFKGMLPGGILVLSEKLCFDNDHHNDLMVALHHYFKRSNGYSELEVAQKRAALENVLLPETLPTHQQRLRRAGFQHVDLWFQCFNFVSMIAIK